MGLWSRAAYGILRRLNESTCQHSSDTSGKRERFPRVSVHAHTMRLLEPLESTLAEVVRMTASLQDDLWIIGSAALSLIGVDVVVADVDLLVSGRDAVLLSQGLIPQSKEEGSDRFRSHYLRYCQTALPIEIMGALEVGVGGRWDRVQPTSRIPIAIRSEKVFVPNATEQLRLLHLFGREKDVARSDALWASGFCTLDPPDIVK